MTKGAAGLAVLLAGCAAPEDENRRAWRGLLRENEALERRVGETMEVEGEVSYLKSGVKIGGVYVDGPPPEGARGRRYKVRGRLVRKEDLPVFHATPENADRAGIPVPEGIDLDLARRRYLLADPLWTPADRGIRD